MAGPWEMFAPAADAGPWTQFAPVEQPPEEKRPGALTAGFKSYLPQLQETYGGVKTLLGVGAERALGEGEISRGLIESGARSMKEAEEARAPLVTPERGSFTDALDKGIGAVLTEWLPFQVGSGAAQLLEALTLAGAGAVAGTVVGTPGVGTAGGAVTGVVARELAKKGVKEAAEKILKERGEEAAKDFFEQEAKKAAIDIGKRRGVNVALAGQAGFYGAGQTTSRAVEEAKKLGGSETDIELARVLPAAAISAAAEFIGDKILLGAVKDLAPGKAGKSAKLDLAKNILLGIVSTGTKEVPVEVIQSAAERYGAKLSLDDAKAIKEYVDAAAASYAMSVVPGGVRGVRTTMAEQAAKRAEPEVEPPEPEAPLAEPPVISAGALEYRPDPYFELPDGSVAKQSEIDAYLATLPEDQQAAIRAKMRPVGRPPERAPRPTMEGYPDKSVATREAAEAYIQKLPEDQRVAARARLLGLAPQPGTEFSPQEIAELEKQQAKAKRKPTAEELIAKARIKTGKPTTERDVTRIQDEYETAVIEGLLAQDAEMQRANELANIQREELAPQVEAEPDVLGPAIADVDQRVREGRIMARVQDLIDRNIPFASTAITDINNKLSVINEAPLSNEERNRIQNIMGMVNVFTGFVNLPQLAPRPVDTRAENQAMEALIKERKDRGPTEPLRATPIAPSPRVEEAPVSQRVGEGAALRPESGIKPSAAQDRQLVTPAPVAPASPVEPAPVVEAAAPTAPVAEAPAPVAEALKAEPTTLTTQIGGSDTTLDLGKPVWQATDEDLVQAVKDSGAYLGKPGSKYDPYMAWREAHTKAIQQAKREGKTFPPKVLYDKPKLIRDDLSDSQADEAIDEMVDVYRATKDYGKAVEAYRNFGKKTFAEAPAAPAKLAKAAKPRKARTQDEADQISRTDREDQQLTAQDIQSSEAVLGDTRAPEGSYYDRTIVGSEVNRKLGADKILTPEQAAQATAYLYRSAVERFDGIVTDENGKPLAVVGGFKGAVSQASVYPATIVAEAVRVPGAAHIWFSHNHPSGSSALSRADRLINESLSDALRGSGIKPMGLLAIAGKRFTFISTKSEPEITGTIEDPSSSTTVPVIERELKQESASGLSVNTPQKAKSIAVQFHERGGDGIIMLNAQNEVIAWVPATDAMRGILRDTGGLNAIYRAISESNAVSAILVHDGSFDEKGKFARSDIKVGQNIGAALKKLDVRVLDTIDVRDQSSAAERAEESAAGPLYSLEEAKSQRNNFFKDLRQLLNKFGLKDVALKIEQDMQEAGTYTRELIRIADRADNPIRTLRHEAIHALRELGFFTDAQWKSLSKMAKDKWIDQYLKQRNVDGKPLKAGEESRYDAYMREYDGDMEKITEEAVADAFADFDATKPPAGLLQTLLRRLRDFFQAMKSALTKVESVDQIFGKVEKGELKRGEKGEAGERKSLGGVRVKAAKAKEDIITAGRAAAQKRAKVQGGRLGEELNTAINKVFVPENETYVEKIERWKDRTWQRIAQGVADQFRTIKDYSEKGYMIATTSKSIDGAMETLMRYGELYNDGGALNVRKDTKGLIEALTPLGKEVDTFFVWMALNREANQPANKKSEFIDPDTGEDLLAKLVAKRNELNQGKMKDPKTGFMVDRAVVYEKARKDMMKLNRSVLDIAHGKVTRKPGEKEPLLNAAIIDDEAFDKFINDAFFVPFYREMEGKGVEHVRTASGLTGQQFSKALKGSALPFADLYNNVLLNWSHILSASMKNAAAVQTIEDALTYGGIEAVVPNLKSQYEWKNNKVYKVGTDELVGDGSLQWNQTTDEGKGVSMVMIDGNKTYFKVTDPLLFEAISAIGYLGKSSKFLDMATKMSQWLRFGVTVSPVFRINNLLRDPVAAAAVAGGKLKFTPLDFVQNTIEGIRLYDPKNESYLGALAGGGIFNMGYRFEGDQSKLIKKLQAAGIDNESILDSDKKIRTALKTLWNKYEEYGNKAESAQRLKLYKTMREKDMSHLEAVFYARDLMDYSKQGAWPAVRILMQTVPFLNARTQGLYKLGRDGIIPTVRTLYNVVNGKSYDQLTEEEKKQRITDTQKAKAFSAVAGAAVAASLLLYFMYKDDEDFKKRDAWDRDNFFWFKVPGVDYAFRIPKPFEIGALATIAERVTEQIVDENAEGKQFGDALSRMLVNTFAFDLPQIIRPAVDLYANKDNFTKAPIEGIGMERRSKGERMTPETSALAIAMSRAWNFILPEKIAASPVQMDYALQAYFGWLGATLGVVSNYAVMPFKDGAYPDARWMDRASLGLIKEMPGRSSGYISSFYENSKAINQAMADMRHYAGLGQMEKAYEIQKDKMDKIQLFGVYQKVGEAISQIRKQADIIKLDKTMSGAEQKQAIDNLNNLMSEYAKMAEDIRKQQKLAK